MVISWIFNSLNLDLANSVLYVETPSEIWMNLQERFSQGDFSHHYQTQRSILTACSPSIMCTCGGQKDLKEKEERIRLGQFLMGLNEIYSFCERANHVNASLPTVKKAYSLLCEEENDLVHAMSIKTHENSRELLSNTEQQIRQSTSSLFCSYFEGTTHTVDRCYYLNGFPVGHKLHSKDNPQFTSEELVQIKAFFRNGKNTAHANYTGISTPFFGATNHIATSIINTTPLSSQVALPNGSYSKIIGIGLIQLLNHLQIKDILCAPLFHVNLLSVSQLTSAMNCSI
ncbi:hypothetical protein ACOSQ2_017599 [Xanthoceras sorbifolium]